MFVWFRGLLRVVLYLKVVYIFLWSNVIEWKNKKLFNFVSLQPNDTARTPAQPAAPPAPMPPAAVTAAWAVEVVGGARGQVEGAVVPAAHAARAASTTAMTWRLPTWRRPPSSIFPRAAGRCPMAWAENPRTCAHRWERVGGLQCP